MQSPTTYIANISHLIAVNVNISTLPLETSPDQIEWIFLLLCILKCHGSVCSNVGPEDRLSWLQYFAAFFRPFREISERAGTYLIRPRPLHSTSPLFVSRSITWHYRQHCYV